jgi:hypothetical protein
MIYFNITMRCAVLSLPVRSVLGLVTCYCFGRYQQAVRRKLGHGTARWLSLVTLTQFHFMFYASRPLPNVFALALGKFDEIATHSNVIMLFFMKFTNRVAKVNKKLFESFPGN